MALSNWVDWCGPNATAIQEKMPDRLMGRMVSNSSRTVYQGLFKKWRIHRGVLGAPPYFPTKAEDKSKNEAAAISYVTLNLCHI